MGKEVILGEVQSRMNKIEEDNKRVASELSLVPNSPDKYGRNKVDLAGNDLERTRPLWENGDIQTEVGVKVLIKSGTPVGLGSKGYVTGGSLEGVFRGVIDYGFVGGAGYMEHGVRRISPYVQMGVELSSGEEVSLRVPRSIFDPVPQVSVDSHSIAA